MKELGRGLIVLAVLQLVLMGFLRARALTFCLPLGILMPPAHVTPSTPHQFTDTVEWLPPPKEADR